MFGPSILGEELSQPPVAVPPDDPWAARTRRRGGGRARWVAARAGRRRRGRDLLRRRVPAVRRGHDARHGHAQPADASALPPASTFAATGQWTIDTSALFTGGERSPAGDERPVDLPLRVRRLAPTADKPRRRAAHRDRDEPLPVRGRLAGRPGDRAGRPRRRRRRAASVAFDARPWSGAETFTWDFGDGTTGTGAQPVTSSSSPGRYQVTVRARSAAGAQDTTQTQVTVTNPLPVGADRRPDDRADRRDADLRRVRIVGRQRRVPRAHVRLRRRFPGAGGHLRAEGVLAPGPYVARDAAGGRRRGSRGEAMLAVAISVAEAACGSGAGDDSFSGFAAATGDQADARAARPEPDPARIVSSVVDFPAGSAEAAGARSRRAATAPWTAERMARSCHTLTAWMPLHPRKPPRSWPRSSSSCATSPRHPGTPARSGSARGSGPRGWRAWIATRARCCTDRTRQGR